MISHKTFPRGAARVRRGASAANARGPLKSALRSELEGLLSRAGGEATIESTRVIFLCIPDEAAPAFAARCFGPLRFERGRSRR